MTDDAVPRFHRFAPNVVTFCGYNGRGIGTGTVFGRVLADHILGKVKENDLPLPVTEPDAPALPALKEAYYEGRRPDRTCGRRHGSGGRRFILISPPCMSMGCHRCPTDNSTSRPATRDEEAFRTDSGLGTSARSSQLHLRDCIYGYRNRQMVQRNEGLRLHSA